jgi:hypothetical protein
MFERKLGRLGLRTFILLLLVFGIAIGLFLRLAMWSRRYARTAGCDHNLAMIYTALMQYHDANGCFPPAYLADANGRPMHSWRVLILPMLFRTDLYNQYNFNEPWDGPNNRKLMTKMPSDFACPNLCTDGSDPATSMLYTNYVVVCGPQTAFPEDRRISVADLRDQREPHLLIAEVGNSDIVWTEPRDLNLKQLSLRMQRSSSDARKNVLSSLDLEGPGMIFADGKRIRLDSTSAGPSP